MPTTIRDPNRAPDVNRIELSGTVAAEPTIKRDSRDCIQRIELKLDVASPIGDGDRFRIDTFTVAFSPHGRPSLYTLSLQVGRDARIRIKGPIIQLGMQFLIQGHKKHFDEACVLVFETEVIEAREPEAQKIPPIPSKPMGNRVRRVQQRRQARNEVQIGGDTFRVFDPKS